MSKFQRGHAKVGGRRKGTPNRVTRDVRESAAAKGFDWLERSIDLMDRAAAVGDLQVEQKVLSDVGRYLNVVPTAANDAKAPGFELASDVPTEDLLEGLI